MQFLPVFLNVRAQHCLVVGGGEVAYRKAVLLDRAGARLRVVAPAIEPQLEALVIAGAGEMCLREFQDNDLEGVFLAVAATDDEQVNVAVSVGAKARGLPVNVVDKPSLCSFIVPAIVDRSPVVIAISSGGASPILTRKLKEKLEQERQEREKLVQQKREQEKKLAEEKRKKELEAKRQQQLKEEREAKQTEALRQENLKRMAGLAGASGSPSATGNALKSAGPSASYAGRIVARVRPNIVFIEDIAGNPSAEVEVRCSPDGTIVGTRLVKSSGNKSWDEAVIKALIKTEVLPRDTDGRVPSPLIISFRPRD